ncbi:hypothetical protein LG275_05050 [Chryseomicrobium palamuruense]
MKGIKVFAITLALILLLAACGTSEETSSTETEQETEEATSGSEETSTDSEEEATEDEGTEEVTIGERVSSDNQPFSIEVMEGYTLTAEEPNRDVLFFDENDSVFMRIETFAKEEADRTALVDTLKQTVQASDSTATLMEISTPAKLPNVDMPIGYEIAVENGKVTGYVFETEAHMVRAIIYDVSDVMKTGDYLEMLSTLQSN